jgi:diguanylate cyclase (GGDEF)-like protein
MEGCHVQQRSEPLADKVYVELVRSLYWNMMPAVIMAGAFATSVALIYRQTDDLALLAIGVAGSLAMLARLTVTRLQRHRALTASLDRRQARRLESAFGVPYMLFSLCLGLFGARVFWLLEPEAHMLTICLLVGYCAGVATCTGLRPYIAIPNMAVAVGPAIVGAVFRADPIYLAMSAITAAFLVGGAQSVLVHYHTAKAEIGKRLTFGSLARRDGLTALPNRLALREYFDDNAALSSPQGVIAVHYLDLDGFKPVNDQFGHGVGDALLAAVAERLTGAIRNGDIAARMGGDEFAILQFGLRRAEESEFLAQRVKSAIRQPFGIGEHTIGVSASVGSVTAEAGQADLEAMLQLADQNLYESKRARKAAASRRAA